ncbi:MAG: ATP-binding protein [Pyrinomonadaceae bacterium]
MLVSSGVFVVKSVRAKLLVVLALLSLPLLIVSLIQLKYYRESLSEQEVRVARAKLNATTAFLETWLRDNSPQLSDSPNEALQRLQEQLRDYFLLDQEAAVTIYDDQGAIVADNGRHKAATLYQPNFSPDLEHLNWSDNVTRATVAQKLAVSGWSVAIGVPSARMISATGGGQLLMVTATWAFALIASTLLAIWAVGRYTNPVRRLAASVSTFGEGNFQERADVETADEVGILAQGFNVMAGQLESRFEELQTQRAFIEEVIDSLPLGLAVLDDQLKVRRVNPTFARFVRNEPSSLRGQQLYEAAGGLSILEDVIEEVQRTRKPFVEYGLALELAPRQGAHEGQEENGDRSHFWDLTLWPITAREAGPGELILILSEVSKRVRAERLATAAFAAERARAAELESLINQMNEGVVIVDRQGRYRVNPAAAEIIGRKRSEFRDGINALLLDIAFRNPEGEKLLVEHTPISRALEQGEHVSGEKLNISRSDGEARVLSVSATPLIGEGDRRDGAVALLRDITDEVRQHNELVASYDRLREHDRLKSAFVATVSHEFRTPLNVIIGICQLLARDTQLPLASLQAEAIGRMERNARSLLELVNALLEYSRLESGRAAVQLDRVAVSEVVGSIVREHLAAAQSKGIILSAEIAPEVGYVITDRRKLTQVISNLVNNAIKFTSAGAVTIRAALVDENHWSLEVRDTGIGITPEALSFVFDEFRQADDTLARAYGGTGLGLAITRKTVELLEGTIIVESRPNEGSCFHVTWPCVAKVRTGTGSLVNSGLGQVAALLQRQAV